MEKLKIEFKHCYGIKELQYVFDFANKNTYAIYAPNGTMKTSFASTFKDFSKGDSSKDLVFPFRQSSRIITDENDAVVPKEQVFVVVPYSQSFKSDRMSTLLVKNELRVRYDEIYEKINDKKNLLIDYLKGVSGLKSELIERSVSSQFTAREDDFLKAISRIKTEVVNVKTPEFSDIVFSKVFNEKSSQFLEAPEFKQKLSDYVLKYNELIDTSTFFRKGIFTHNNASAIAKSLSENGFFEANHSIILNGEDISETITTIEELTSIIQAEKDSILNNPELKKAFDQIDVQLGKNADLRNFRDYIMEKPQVLPELENVKQFQEKLWISYLADNKELVTQLDEEYLKGKEEIESIIQQAEREVTEWRSVIDEFNKRFSVPFLLKMRNQQDVILKGNAPSIKFEFTDKDDSCEIDETKLYNVLSNGESRALYILNILFEVQARRKDNLATLFIIDDIADSFDYKNKYAIIEYIAEVSKTSLFKQIILTHNYDFFRTVFSRLSLNREQVLNSVRTDNKIILEEDVYQNDPFKHWKKHFHSERQMLLAAIPFVRNIVEYTGDVETFNTLTTLLHIQPGNTSIKVKDLEAIYRSVLQNLPANSFQNQETLVIDLIFSESSRISSTIEDTLRLEDKIVLAIGIRLKSELFMISKINEDDFIQSIKKNQTRKLFEKFVELFPNDLATIEILDKVNLMTPENIHLNSFMYEPIIDMSNDHLRRLYHDVSLLLP